MAALLAPSCLNVAERYAAPDVVVEEDLLTAKYVGRGNHGADHGTVRSNVPAPPNQFIFYFEVVVVDAGLNGAITVGLSAPSFKLVRQVGTRDGSCGYRGSDGRKFVGKPTGQPYSAGFGPGDVVGCGVNFVKGEVFFTKNGVSLGPAMTGLPADQALFPSVSLHSPGATVKFNFGREPFSFDVASVEAAARTAEEEAVARTEIDARVCVPLIRSYLAHHAYGDTLRALSASYGFGQQLQQQQQQQQQSAGPGGAGGFDNGSLGKRREVLQLIETGRVGEAFGRIEAEYPGLLVGSPSTAFRLRCQQFVELVREGRVDDALSHARTQLATFKSDSASPHDQLGELVGLLAYQNASESPLAHLLDQSRRQAVAEEVNRAILRHLGEQQERPPLETLLRQLVAVSKHLRRPVVL